MLHKHQLLSFLSGSLILMSCLFCSITANAEVGWWNDSVPSREAYLPLHNDPLNAFPEKGSEGTRRLTSNEILRFGSALASICTGENFSVCEELEPFGVVASDEIFSPPGCFMDTSTGTSLFTFHAYTWNGAPAEAVICLVHAVTRHASWTLPGTEDLCYLMVNEESEAAAILDNAFANLIYDFRIHFGSVAHLGKASEKSLVNGNGIIERFKTEQSIFNQLSCQKTIASESFNS